MDATKPYTDLLVDLILAHSDADGGYQIPINTVLRSFGVEMSTFYQKLYQRRDIAVTIAPDSVETDNLRLLAPCLGVDEKQFVLDLNEIGVLLSVDHQLELVETIIDAAIRDQRSHHIDEELFEGMRRRYPDVRRAATCYMEYCFDTELYKSHAAETFLATHPRMHPIVARQSVARLIDLLFTRHILTEEMLYDDILRRLLSTADETRDFDAMEPEIADALSALGLSTLPDSNADLKRVYRTLMKTYHPDVNPGGLAMSQRITHAYRRIVELGIIRGTFRRNGVHRGASHHGATGGGETRRESEEWNPRRV